MKHIIDKQIQGMIENLVGETCWRKEVGRNRSLSLGFGERVHHKTTLTDKVYGSWELGTYDCAWRLVKDARVVCGSQDAVDSIADLNARLEQFDLGRFSSLQHLAELDLRVKFDSDFVLDILTTISDEDESFHIFCPRNVVVIFSVLGGWSIGPSDKPWSEEQ